VEIGGRASNTGRGVRRYDLERRASVLGTVATGLEACVEKHAQLGTELRHRPHWRRRAVFEFAWHAVCRVQIGETIWPLFAHVVGN
jgi:hypothetical protein